MTFRLPAPVFRFSPALRSYERGSWECKTLLTFIIEKENFRQYIRTKKPEQNLDEHIFASWEECLMKRSFLRFIILAAATLHLSAVPTADSLSVYGRVLCDSTGLAGVKIGDSHTESSGYFHIMIPAGVDTVLTPSFRAFTFSPAYFEISASDTSIDSLIFVA